MPDRPKIKAFNINGKTVFCYEEWGTPPNTDLMKVQNWINQKDDDDEPSNDDLDEIELWIADDDQDY